MPTEAPSRTASTGTRPKSRPYPSTLRARVRRLAAEAAAVDTGALPELSPEDRAALRALGYAE